LRRRQSAKFKGGAELPDGINFQTKNPNFGKFWKVLQWKILVYFGAILSILQPNGILFGDSVHFVVIWYIFPLFGMLRREKSGNLGVETEN
jgi:hypothetical protein